MRYVAGKVITKLVLIQYLEEEEISFYHINLENRIIRVFRENRI